MVFSKANSNKLQGYLRQKKA